VNISLSYIANLMKAESPVSHEEVIKQNVTLLDGSDNEMCLVNEIFETLFLSE
jgi:hypothetical protein